MTTHDAPTTPIEVISPDGLQGEPWSADLADAEFARMVKGTKLVTPVTRILLGLLVAAAGFIGGVLVERSQQPAASSSAATGAAAFRAGGANAANAGAGASGPGGGATVGTITLIDGANLYVTTAEGDVVKVVTNPQTAISVSKSGTVADLDPAKTVIVQGTADSDGTVTASQITQGGAGFGGAGGTGGRRNGGGAGASTASRGG